MPDKKLTDSEIVKALPFLAKCCKDEYNDIRVDKVLLGALDLINRIEARIGIYETCNARKDEAIKHLENEVKRLQAENERLKAPTTDWLVRGISPEQLEQEKIQVWKAEAYKEFAKELKHKAINIGVNDSIVSTYVIDNLLKELVGDK